MKLFLALLLGGALATTAAMIVLRPNETGTLRCNSDELVTTRQSITQVDYACVQFTPVPVATNTPLPTATNTPLPTDTPVATATPHGDTVDLTWHAPGSHGDRPAHEHGDAAPQWVLDAGYAPSFTHVAGTVGENVAYWKHTGFKGWAGTLKGVDFFGIFHLDANPGGQTGRFHSYQIWLRDGTGAVSHMHGWVDFGQDNNTLANTVVVCSTGTAVRPVIMVNQAGCNPVFENWYARPTAVWGVDFGFNLAPNYYGGGDPLNPATWTSIDGQVHNQARGLEFAWYAGRSSLRGTFYATQFGDVVSGPNDPLCATSRTYGERSYTLVCLQQVVQPTLSSIEFPDNRADRNFASAGVVLPN